MAVSSAKPTQWLVIQGPGRYALGADDDVSSRFNEAMMKRSINDENQEENPPPKRKRPGQREYMREWRANRLKRLNAPETPLEVKAQIQAAIEEERNAVKKVNRYISMKDAEKVLDPEEMKTFRTLREAHNRFRRANKTMQRRMREARKTGRQLTESELSEWEEILAGNRAHAKMSREIAKRLDAREREGGSVAQSPSHELEAQQPQAPTEEKEQQGDTSLDIHPSDLNNPFVDGVKKIVQKTGSDLGESRLVKAVQRAASTFHPPSDFRPVSPNVGPGVPTKGLALLWRH